MLEKMIRDTQNTKIYANLASSEASGLRVHFSSLFDRSDVFKTQISEILSTVYLEIIQKFVAEETIRYLRTIRGSEKPVA